MSCIDDHLIQKYIDGETNSSEREYVEAHLSACRKCSEKTENRKLLTTAIKKSLRLSAKEAVIIPPFSPSSQQTSKSSHALARLSFFIPAAAVILFIILFADRRKNENMMVIEPNTGSSVDIDANRPVSQFPLVLYYIDDEGNTYEYSVK